MNQVLVVEDAADINGGICKKALTLNRNTPWCSYGYKAKISIAHYSLYIFSLFKADNWYKYVSKYTIKIAYG